MRDSTGDNWGLRSSARALRSLPSWACCPSRQCSPSPSTKALKSFHTFGEMIPLSPMHNVTKLRSRSADPVPQAIEPGQVSLSPATIQQSSGIERLVLPLPNGSAISHYLAAAGSRVTAVSFRNADAAAEFTTARLRDIPQTVVAVIAAGERWTDGSLRPALEDLRGAGGSSHAWPTGASDRCRQTSRSWLRPTGGLQSSYPNCCRPAPVAEVWSATATHRTWRSPRRSTRAGRCPVEGISFTAAT